MSAPTAKVGTTARHLRTVAAQTPGTVAVPPGLIALFRIPFAVEVTADVWAEVITWSHPGGTGHRHQSEEARLTDLLWMVTVVAAQPITLGRARRFNLWRVPNTTPGGLPRRVRLTLTVDTARAANRPPVATIAAAPAPPARCWPGCVASTPRPSERSPSL